MIKALVLLLSISSVLATVQVAMNCPDGWKWFKRSRGGWCMKVYAGTMNFPDADAKCKIENATVAGVQNMEENTWMSQQMKALQANNVLMWIGLKRTNACIGSGLTATCTLLTSFYWSDGSVVGVSGFKWHGGEPNNMGGHQDCSVLKTDFNTFDDFSCTDLQVTGYVCGKIASFD